MEAYIEATRALSAIAGGPGAVVCVYYTSNGAIHETFIVRWVVFHYPQSRKDISNFDKWAPRTFWTLDTPDLGVALKIQNVDMEEMRKPEDQSPVNV